MNKKILFAIFIISIAAQTLCFAGEINFELKLKNEKIYQGKQTELRAVFNNSKDIPAPEMPFVNGLNFKYIKSDQKEATADNEASVTHIYRVAALRAGSFDIGPVSFDYNGDRYISNSIQLTVEKEELLPRPSGEISEAQGKISDHIYLVLEAPKSEVFVNEELPFKVKLFSDWLDLENISLSQKPSENLIVRAFGNKVIGNMEKNGIKYAVLEYPSSLIAATAGAYQLNPVEVTLDVVMPKEDSGAMPGLLNDNKEFYDRFIANAPSRRLTLQSPPLIVTARQIPVENRPDDFKGAVGKFDFDIKVSSTSVKPGDTLKLTMSISGLGNYDTVVMPAMGAIRGARMYEPKVAKTSSSMVSERAIKVESGEFSGIPQISFSFFDPDNQKFITITKGPVAVKVEGYENRPALKEVKPVTREAITIVPLKDSVGSIGRYDMRFYRNNIFIVLGIMPVLAVLAASIIRRRMEFLLANPKYAAMLRASKKARARVVKAQELSARGRADEFYGMIFNIMQIYLGERAIIPEAGITAKVLDEMPDSGMSPDVYSKIKKIFSDCYMAKYASINFGADEMAGTLKEVEYVITELDKKEFNA